MEGGNPLIFFPPQFCSSRENKVLVSSLIVLTFENVFTLALIVDITVVKHCSRPCLILV